VILQIFAPFLLDTLTMFPSKFSKLCFFTFRKRIQKYCEKRRRNCLETYRFSNSKGKIYSHVHGQ